MDSQTVLRRLGCLLVIAAACSEGVTSPVMPPPEVDPPDVPSVDSIFPLTELPALLSELDLSQAVSYAPKWALWSNGLEKDRRIQLPTGARIDISDPAVWRFPGGGAPAQGLRRTPGGRYSEEGRDPSDLAT